MSLAVGMASIFAALPGMSGLMALVSVALVSGAVHSDDDRYRDARGPLSDSGNGGAGLCAVSPDELVAWGAAEQRVCGRVLVLFDRDGKYLDDLADVRRGESVAGDAGALYRDDGVDQNVEVALSLGHGGADVVCRRGDAGRVL